uniref:Uncharacterized protein n=1 Tax=Anguilla anguilla TaxID=7936 RepID=A0A0E9P8I9_ANGAN
MQQLIVHDIFRLRNMWPIRDLLITISQA